MKSLTSPVTLSKHREARATRTACAERSLRDRSRQRAAKHGISFDLLIAFRFLSLPAVSEEACSSPSRLRNIVPSPLFSCPANFSPL